MASDNETTQNLEAQDETEKEMSGENVPVETPVEDATTNRTPFVKIVLGKVGEMMNVELLDEETTKMVERIVLLRLSTKHINLWTRQLEMKRREIGELAGLVGFDEVKMEVANEKSLERWARRCTHHFPKKVKRMLFEEIDNMVWSGREKEVSRWCDLNKVYDEIT